VITPLTFGLVVACALGWAAFDVARKALVARVPPLALMFLLAIGQAPLLALWWAIEGGGFGPGYAAPAAGSVALNVVANVAFIYAFQRSPLSVTVPLLSLTPAFTALFAIPLLGEVPTLSQVAGIALVVAGALLLNRAPGESAAPAALWRAFLREPGARLMVLVALCWSVTPSLDKLAMAAAPAPAHGVVLGVGVAVGVLGLMVARGRIGDLRHAGAAPGLLAVALVTSALAMAFQLLAIHVVWVAIVETVKRGLGSAVALGLGWLMFGERVTAGRIGAVALMTAGVALVLL
jgi:uncharacterized membrane protein